MKLFTSPVWDTANEGAPGIVIETDDEPASSKPTAQPSGPTDKFENRLNALSGQLDSFVNSAAQDAVRRQQAEIDGHKHKIEGLIDRAKKDLTSAQQAIQTAQEDGDAAEVARQTRFMVEATAERERRTLELRDFNAQIENRRQSSAPEPKLDTSNRDAWTAANKSWYGIDTAMTDAVREIDAQIRANKVIEVGTKDYFNALDQQMKRRFPEQLGGSPSTSGAMPQPSASGSGGPLRIPASIVTGMHHMGIDLKDPDVQKRYQKARADLVDKGILPQDIIRERVITR